MRRALGPLLLTTLLTAGLAAGCGDDGSGTATDPDTGTPSPSSSGSPVGDGTVDFDQVALISQSGGGGRVDEHATALDDQAAVDAFAGQFRTDRVGNQIAAAIRKADVPDGQTVVGAVVSIGCDVPPGVAVHGTGDRLTITPMKVTSPMQECLVPVTTVALVAVDSSAA